MTERKIAQISTAAGRERCVVSLWMWVYIVDGFGNAVTCGMWLAAGNLAHCLISGFFSACGLVAIAMTEDAP